MFVFRGTRARDASSKVLPRRLNRPTDAYMYVLYNCMDAAYMYTRHTAITAAPTNLLYYTATNAHSYIHRVMQR